MERDVHETFTDEWKSSWDDSDDEVDNEGRRPMKFRDFASHELDMLETDGFDIQDYSEFSDPGVLVQLYDPPEKPADKMYVAELEDCACDAINHYNREHGTHYGNVHVVKANSEALAPCRYYITFQASDKRNNKQTFQARVNISFSAFKKDDGLKKDVEFVKEVELVRIKTAPNLIDFIRSPKASYK